MTARQPLPGSYAQPMLPQLRPTVQQAWERRQVVEWVARQPKYDPLKELRRRLEMHAASKGWSLYPSGFRDHGPLVWMHKDDPRVIEQRRLSRIDARARERVYAPTYSEIGHMAMSGTAKSICERLEGMESTHE